VLSVLVAIDNEYMMLRDNELVKNYVLKDQANYYRYYSRANETSVYVQLFSGDINVYYTDDIEINKTNSMGI